jgi:hypothetical protein
MTSTYLGGRASTEKSAMRWIKRGVGILGLSTLIADGGLSQDQLDCEEAVSYLQGCCPGFQASETVACESDQGCGTSTDPALSISDSQCIVSLSCSDLVSRGICARVQNLPSPMTDDGTTTGDHGAVCP